MRVGATLLMYGLVTWHLLIDMSLLTGAPTIIITMVRRRIKNDLDDRAFSLITSSWLRRTTKVPNQRHIELEIKVLIVRKCLRHILDVLRKTKETLNGTGGRHRSGFQESTAARLYIHWKGHSMFSIAADNGKTSKLSNKKKKIMFNFHFYHRRHDHHCT